jgi:hypothetical protein
MITVQFSQFFIVIISAEISNWQITENLSILGLRTVQENCSVYS